MGYRRGVPATIPANLRGNFEAAFTVLETVALRTLRQLLKDQGLHTRSLEHILDDPDNAPDVSSSMLSLTRHTAVKAEAEDKPSGGGGGGGGGGNGRVAASDAPPNMLLSSAVEAQGLLTLIFSRTPGSSLEAWSAFSPFSNFDKIACLLESGQAAVLCGTSLHEALPSTVDSTAEYRLVAEHRGAVAVRDSIAFELRVSPKATLANHAADDESLGGAPATKRARHDTPAQIGQADFINIKVIARVGLLFLFVLQLIMGVDCAWRVWQHGSVVASTSCLVADLSWDDARRLMHLQRWSISQDQTRVHYKIKRSTPMRKLKDAFCTRQGLDVESVRFLFQEEQIGHYQTPNDLRMEENDTIDVMYQQTGGCIAAPVPAIFGKHAGTPGLQYLTNPAALSASTPQDAVALIKQLAGRRFDGGARPGARVVCIPSSAGLLKANERGSLMRSVQF
jgi:small ubiquitin-related modifier